ncbi:hypothetical protein D3C79_884770 [compost metagenome]
MVVMVQMTIRITLIALRSIGRMVRTRVLGWRALRRPTGGLSASWMAVSSTTHSSQVTSRIRPMLDSELLIAWPRLLLRAKSTTEKPQMRPSSSMKVTAMAMRSSAWARLRSSSL